MPFCGIGFVLFSSLRVIDPHLGGVLQRLLHNAVQRARIDSHRPDLYRDIFADDLNRPLEPTRPIHIYSAVNLIFLLNEYLKILNLIVFHL